MLQNFLEFKILDNSIYNYLWCAGTVLSVFLFKKYLSQIVSALLYNFFRRYSKHKELNKFYALLLQPTQWFLMLLTAYVALQFLKYPVQWNVIWFKHPLKNILEVLLDLVLCTSATWILLRMADFIGYAIRQRNLNEKPPRENHVIPFVKDSVKVLIIMLALLFAFSQIMHFNIASLIAGLGIGGLAIALAAQDTIGNLFGSLAIFLDHPFSVGDLVKIGDVTGHVEKVGFRSTRIRTLDKTYLSVPNKKVTDTFLDNLTHRTARRVNQVIGLAYDTSSEKLKTVVEEMHLYLQTREGLSKESYARFQSFGEATFNIEIEYFCIIEQLTDFVKVRGEINFDLMEIVERNEARFAFPVREVVMKK